MDRANLRPARPPDARIRGRRWSPSTRLGERSPQASSRRCRGTQHQAAADNSPISCVAILSAVHVPLRSLFLFVGRDRGAVGSQGPADQPGHDAPSASRWAHFWRSRSSSTRRSYSGRCWSGRRSRESSALEAAIPLGKPGLLLALLGMLFAVAGAAVETCMANAYAVAQFFGWEWGRHKKPWEAPRFTHRLDRLSLLALSIVLTGIDVMSLVEYAIVFSIVVLPLTYLPLMLLANDKSYMGEYANKWLAKGLGWTLFRDRHRGGGRRHPALSADIGRTGMKPRAPDQAGEPAARPSDHRQGRALVRDRRRCRARRERRQGDARSRRCWSAPAPMRAGCPRWLFWMVRKIAGDRMVRVPAVEIDRIGSVVQLEV